MSGKISYFKSLPEKGKPHVCSEVIELDDFLSGIKYGKWQSLIEPIRKEIDKPKRDRLKKALPSVTIGGVFKERNTEGLIDHSGFICVDIDAYNDKTALLQDKYTYALFRSTSGNGIAVVVRVNPDKHKESYRWLEHYYFSTFGISVDPAPKNVASLRYVSYDPDIYINPRALLSKTKSETPRKIQSVPIIIPDDQVGEMVSQVVSSRQNIAPDYDSYLKMGFAIASGFGENGRAYFHALASVSEKYHSQQAEKQYDRCLDGASKSGISVGTFYWMLQSVGVKLPRTNTEAVQVAAMAKKSGRTKEGAVMQMVEIHGMDQQQAEHIATEVFDRTDIDLAKVAKDPDQLIQSLVAWIKMNHPVRVNAITRMLEDGDKEVKKEQINTIYLRARMYFNTKEVTQDLIKSILFSDMIADFNPITEYINQNRHRNSHGQIDALIDCIETDTPHAEIFIRKWLVSLIAAHEGYPVRAVLALVGVQRTGKTEFFRRLLPSKLEKYYGESKLDSGKDDELLMSQRLIVMDDEMGGKSKQDEKRFKELTSKKIFSLRAPYAAYNEDFKRLAVLCGTSNDRNVINDPTGNTRILPVNVISIDHEAYNDINKDELFMELVRVYESGYEWQLNKAENEWLGEVSGNFEAIPYERELISQFFKAASVGGGYIEHLTSTEIKDFIEKSTVQRISNKLKFGQELRNVLGDSKITSRNGSNARCYSVIRVSGHGQTETIKEDLPF
jgi:hypothetical protein